MTYISQTFYTKRNDIWRELYKILYPNGILHKQVYYIYILMIVELVDVLPSHGLGFALCNFNAVELDWFCSFLLEQYALQATIHKQNQYWDVYIDMESTKRLLSRFLTLSDTVDSIGLIGKTKL